MLAFNLATSDVRFIRRQVNKVDHSFAIGWLCVMLVSIFI